MWLIPQPRSVPGSLWRPALPLPVGLSQAPGLHVLCIEATGPGRKAQSVRVSVLERCFPEGWTPGTGCASETQTSWLHIEVGTEYLLGFLGGASGKGPACQCRRHKRHWFDSWVGKIPWRRHGNPLLLFLPGESHGWRSLAGYSPWDRRESDMTGWLSMHTHMSGLLPQGACKLVWMPTVLSGGNTVRIRVVYKLASDVLL